MSKPSVSPKDEVACCPSQDEIVEAALECVEELCGLCHSPDPHAHGRTLHISVPIPIPSISLTDTPTQHAPGCWPPCVMV